MGLFDFFGSIIFFPVKFFNEKAGRENIIVMRVDQAGDVIQTIPFFEKLRKKYPRSKVTALVTKNTSFVLRGNKNIDSIVEMETSWFYKKKKLDNTELIKKLRQEKYSLGFDLRGDLRNIMFLKKAGVKCLAGYGCAGGGFLLNSSKPYDRAEHEIVKNLKLIDEETPDDIVMDFGIDGKEKEEVKADLEIRGVSRDTAFILIHPFAATGSRMWDLKKYAELIRLIKEKKPRAAVAVTGSLEEKDKAKELLVINGVVDFMGYDFRKTLILAGMADVFIGNDSSIQHFAAYQGVRSCIVYAGVVDYRSWFPRARQTVRINREVDCAPCELQECDKKVHECMESITAQDVFKKIERWGWIEKV